MSEAQKSKKVTGVSKVSDVSKVTKVLTEEILKTHLITQSLVLDLLHARRVSPVVLAHKPAQSARYPDLLTSFAPSVRKSASHLITLKVKTLAITGFTGGGGKTFKAR